MLYLRRQFVYCYEATIGSKQSETLTFLQMISSFHVRPPPVEGTQLAANPTTQWFYSSVSKASLQKTGVFLDSAGDFGNVRPKKFEHRSPETFGDEKSPHLAGLSHPKKDIL